VLSLCFGLLPQGVKVLSDVNSVHDQKPDEYDEKIERIKIARRRPAFEYPAADFGQRDDDDHSDHRREDKLYDNAFERLIFVRHFSVKVNHDTAQRPPRAPALNRIERIGDEQTGVELNPVVGQVIVEGADERDKNQKERDVVVLGCRHGLYI
jgi:hypothetical protein